MKSYYSFARVRQRVRDVVPEDIGYVLSTTTVPEFMTGREFLKFFLDIHEETIPNPKNLDEYSKDLPDSDLTLNSGGRVK